MSRAVRAMSKDFMTLLRLRSEMVVGDNIPASFCRLACTTALYPSAISVHMSASFFWTSWLRAKGAPNILRSRTYWREVSKQNSAAPSTPQAIPKRALFKQLKGPCLIIKTKKRNKYNEKPKRRQQNHCHNNNNEATVIP
jgi:hypothetical protein